MVLASAVPLAVFTAIASHQVRDASWDGPSQLIALVGGSSAAVLLALSGLSSLTLTRPHITENAAVVRALHGLALPPAGQASWSCFMVFTELLVARISLPALSPRPPRS